MLKSPSILCSPFVANEQLGIPMVQGIRYCHFGAPFLQLFRPELCLSYSTRAVPKNPVFWLRTAQGPPTNRQLPPTANREGRLWTLALRGHEAGPQHDHHYHYLPPPPPLVQATLRHVLLWMPE